MATLLYRRLLLILAVASITLGATSSSCSLSNSDDDDDGDEPSFVVDLVLRDKDNQIANRFERGEGISLELTVRNRLNTSAQIDFTDGRTYDFVIVRENTDDVVWKWSEGQTFSQVATTLEFTPGETKTFQFTWTQLGDDNSQVRRGTYEARGVMVFSGFDSNPLRSNPLGSTLEQFTID